MSATMTIGLPIDIELQAELTTLMQTDIGDIDLLNGHYFEQKRQYESTKKIYRQFKCDIMMTSSIRIVE